MPALIPTDYYGEITWLGVVEDADASLRSTARTALPLTFEGADGEAHNGLTRASCVRVTSQHPKGTEIRNVRQFSILGQEELDEIAADCGLSSLDPKWLGATLVLRGIPDFTHIPPSARLQGPDGATLIVDMENQPCVLPGREIEKDRPGHGTGFKTAATDKRGVTACVERPGVLEIGQKMRLHVPAQRAWTG